MEGSPLFGESVYRSLGIPASELMHIDSAMRAEQAEAIYMSMFGSLLAEASQYITDYFPDQGHYNYFIGSIVSALQDKTGRFNFHFLQYGTALEYVEKSLQDMEDGIQVLRRRSKSEAYLNQEEPEILYIDIVTDVNYLQSGSDHSLHIYLPQELFAEAFGSFSGSIYALCEIMELGMNIYKANYPDREIGIIDTQTVRDFQDISMQAGGELVARVLVDCAYIYQLDLDEFLNTYLYTYCQTNPTVLALLEEFVDPAIFSRSQLDLTGNNNVGSSYN